MKHKSIAILIFCVSVATTARAQTVTGSGTAGNIAKFTDSSTIGNSVVVESNGNIGIGTTNPLLPLVVTNLTWYRQRSDCP